MPKMIEIDWSEHPDINALEDWIRKEFSWDQQKSYAGSFDNCHCIDDYKNSAKSWAQEQTDLLKELIERIDKLPEGKESVIMIDEDAPEDKTPRTCKKWENDYQGWGHCPVCPDSESLNANDPVCKGCKQREEMTFD